MDETVKQYLAKIGKKGGKAQVTKGIGTLSPEERSARAREGAAARWGTKKAAKKAAKTSKKT